MIAAVAPPEGPRLEFHKDRLDHRVGSVRRARLAKPLQDYTTNKTDNLI